MGRWDTGLFDDDSSLDAFAMYHTNPNGAEYFDEVIDRLYVSEFLDLDDCADFLVGLSLYLNYLKEDSVDIPGDYQVNFSNKKYDVEKITKILSTIQDPDICELGVIIDQSEIDDLKLLVQDLVV